MYEIYEQMKYFMTVCTKRHQLYQLPMYSPIDLNFKLQYRTFIKIDSILTFRKRLYGVFNNIKRSYETKVCKNGPSKICGRQPLKKLNGYPFKFFKGCLPQILLGPFLNALAHPICWLI